MPSLARTTTPPRTTVLARTTVLGRTTVLARTTVLVGVALAAGLFTAPPASAATTQTASRGEEAVFVQSDALTGNQVVAFDRAADGTLQQAGVYATGGLGGRLAGAAADFTASQGALTADREHAELYAVNPGSDTLSVFAVHGDQLRLRQVVQSGGSFPVSVTVHDDLVYVLDARDGGSVQGYRNVDGRLVLVPRWHRDLGLAAGTPEFTHTPGQVLFTPDGRHLVVSTKAASNSLLVYGVGRSGRLSGAPVVRAENGTVPFALAFDDENDLTVADTGTNAVATYRVRRNGTLTLLGVTPTGQAATCWLSASGNLLAASNAGSGTVTTLRATGAAATKIGDFGTAGGGTVDSSFTPSGDYLYVQTGATGGVDAFAVAADGTLTRVGSMTVPDAVGGEGIVAW